jgi:RimJ/RimL family protein N-acetyltransferase
VKNETLNSLIESLNKNQYQEDIFLKSLSDDVDFAFVWVDENLNKLKKSFHPYKMYFIKNKKKQYVGAVLDMGGDNDLHWFVVTKYRKRGYLTNALINTILPHLFLDRKEQKISIDKSQLSEQDALNSIKVAEKVGFTILEADDENDIYESHEKSKFEYLLLKNKVKKFVKILNSHTLQKERLKLLLARIDILATSINVIRYEFDASLGKSCNLKNISKSLKYQQMKLEDLWWDCEKK